MITPSSRVGDVTSLSRQLDIDIPLPHLFFGRSLIVEKQVWIDYINYRHERRWYRILPVQMRWAANDYHKEEQWLIEAMDLDRPGVVREFAWTHIKEMRNTPPTVPHTGKLSGVK